ncbi:MAG: hypothetical protein U9N36_09760 [Euryarchaeota archaeon]|nr:hypothetical protein [Euryarchaeota archaeon]
MYSDYNSTDPDGDSIGDGPYSIPGGRGSIDRSPFIRPGAGDISLKDDLNHDNRIISAYAAIALVIAASGGLGADADVSGDHHATSLDALTILRIQTLKKSCQ